MGTPRPHVSRHVSGRAPRRGRRPRRPASAHPRIPAYSRLSLRRGRRPRRPVFRSPIAGCTRVLHVCLRWPYFFQQRKKYGKERRQKPSVFGFPFRPIVTAVQKGSAPNRLHSYSRCRSCVRRENFLLSRRTEKVLYILHNFVSCGPKGRTYLSQPAGKRHLLPRPAFERPRWAHPAHTYLAMSPVAHPVGTGVPDGPFSVLRLRAAPASCICLRWPYFFQQRKKYGKERRQKPTVFGFPFRPIVTAVQKGSAPNRLQSYPRCRSCVPRENFLLSRRTEEVLYILHTFIFCGPKGRTYTCRRRRQVRDLIIVLNDRPASPPPTTSAAARVNPWPIPCGTFSIRTEIGL